MSSFDLPKFLRSNSALRLKIIIPAGVTKRTDFEYGKQIIQKDEE